MQLLRNLKLRNLILLSLLAVSLIPLAGIAALLYQRSAQALEQEAINRLDVVRSITAKSVQRYFESLQDELVTAADAGVAGEALRSMAAALPSLAEAESADLSQMRQMVLDCHESGLGRTLEKAGENDALVATTVQSLDDLAVRMQSLYIADNPLL